MTYTSNNEYLGYNYTELTQTSASGIFAGSRVDCFFATKRKRVFFCGELYAGQSRYFICHCQQAGLCVCVSLLQLCFCCEVDVLDMIIGERNLTNIPSKTTVNICLVRNFSLFYGVMIIKYHQIMVIISSIEKLKSDNQTSDITQLLPCTRRPSVSHHLPVWCEYCTKKLIITAKGFQRGTNGTDIIIIQLKFELILSGDSTVYRY